MQEKEEKKIKKLKSVLLRIDISHLFLSTDRFHRHPLSILV